MRANHTEIVCILDRSGSMLHLWDEAIIGFNAFIDDQLKVPGTANCTLVLFDDYYEEVYAGKPLADIPVLTREVYSPRGFTALLDAVGRTVDTVGARLAALPEHQRADKVCVCILTDGLENASHEYTSERVKEMVIHQQDKYGWAFICRQPKCLGYRSCAAMGYRWKNTASFTSTSKGIREAYGTMSSTTSAYRANP